MVKWIDSNDPIKDNGWPPAPSDETSDEDATHNIYIIFFVGCALVSRDKVQSIEINEMTIDR